MRNSLLFIFGIFVLTAAQEESDPCLLPSEAGLCRAGTYVVTFDQETGSCVPAPYGGCVGRGNWFSGIAHCEEVCAQHLKVHTDICTLPPVPPGPSCAAYMPRWTYNASEGKCVPYIYFGCYGTENLFHTEAECKNKCHKDVENVCLLDIDAGPCNAYEPSFGYNKVTGRCESFIYGGCNGNENRFETVQECDAKCRSNNADFLTDCSDVKCDSELSHFYQFKGCSPITKPGDCCPSSWDCSFWEERMSNKNKCFAVSPSHPRGKLYDPWESVDTYFDRGCNGGCYCMSFSGVAMCGISDCYSPRPNIRYDEGKPVIDRCDYVYDHADSCCPSQKCNEELDKLGTCVQDGKEYLHGKKYYPKDNPCKKCLCKPNDGEDPCHPVDCGFHSSWQMNMGCVPVFLVGQCCPMSRWLYPDDFKNAYVVSTSEAGEPSSRSDVDPCTLEMSAGPCRNWGLRYFYNTATDSCEKFLYGGCRGNGNNFLDEESCNRKCKPVSEASRFCKVGNLTFALGDTIQLDDHPCTKCVCSTPPDITCFRKRICPGIRDTVYRESVNCNAAELDEDGCCVTKDDLGCCNINVCPKQDERF